MIPIREYISNEGESPFRQWFDDPDAQAAAIVTRMATPLNVKPIGEGAAELRIDRGPGYRIYFGWDGKVLVILLGGGTKRRQRHDIEAALRRWRDYKRRKAESRKG